MSRNVYVTGSAKDDANTLLLLTALVFVAIFAYFTCDTKVQPANVKTNTSANSNR